MSNIVPYFSDDQLNIIRNKICFGASEDEVAVFIAICKRTTLDPFARQIYMVERRFKDRQGNWQTKYEAQSSIDGFRVVAERSGSYEGQLGPFWCGKDGKWVDVWLSNEPPVAAKVGLLKTKFKEPLWAIAKWTSYCQTNSSGQPTKMWAKMPDLMLAKCAEALAIRRAFPNDLSGLYTSDEMAQASQDEPLEREVATRQVVESKPHQTALEAPKIEEPMPDSFNAPLNDEELDLARSKSPHKNTITVSGIVEQVSKRPPPNYAPGSDNEVFEPGDYVMPCGKFRGKKLKFVPIDAVKSSKAWAEGALKTNGSSAMLKDLVSYSAQYLEQVGPTETTDEELPF